MADIMDNIAKYAEQIPSTDAVDVLMGIEGNIRQTYYDSFSLILNDFEMGSRTKQSFPLIYAKLTIPKIGNEKIAHIA